MKTTRQQWVGAPVTELVNDVNWDVPKQFFWMIKNGLKKTVSEKKSSFYIPNPQSIAIESSKTSSHIESCSILRVCLKVIPDKKRPDETSASSAWLSVTNPREESSVFVGRCWHVKRTPVMMNFLTKSTQWLLYVVIICYNAWNSKPSVKHQSTGCE